MKRRVYLYQKNISEELVELFNSFGENISVENVADDVITVFDNDYYNEDPIDLIGIKELIQDDFGGNVVIFIEPYLEADFELGNSIKKILKDLPLGIYFLEDVIPYVVLQKKNELKEEIMDYIYSQVSNDVVHTVREFIENNMNSSLSAKKLFMHRNTLNYRIDNFIEATHINVKTFKGANAIYMLFKY